MKWALAGSQFLLLAVLIHRGYWRLVPGFACYLVFAVVSSVTYDPWNPSLFAWMSLPSVLLRSIVCVECVSILVSRHNETARALMAIAAVLGSLLILSASWGFPAKYTPWITLAIYCSLGIAAALWTVIGIMWVKDALARDWRRWYALSLGTYFGVWAIARVSGWWIQNASIVAYIVIFLWLSKQFFQLLGEPRNEHADHEDQNEDGDAFNQVAL
jgi:hypothetical protein